MQDLRNTPTWQRVEEHFRRVHEPAFGQVHRLLDICATSAGGLKVAATGSVLEGLEGLPRQVVTLVEDNVLRQITYAVGSSRQPRFSLDGETLAFLSDRAEAGRFQLYLLQADGVGEARLLCEVPGTVEYFSWSPDGSQLLLGVAGLGADLAGGEGSGKTHAPETHLPRWMPSVDAGVTEHAWRSLWVYRLADDLLRQATPTGVNVWEAAWLGSDSLVAVASSQPDESAWYTANLVEVGGDRTVRELASSQVQFGLPSGSPSGQRLAVVQAFCSDRLFVAGELMVGTPSVLRTVDTSGIDVTCMKWIDDDRLGFVGIRGLETVAAVFDAETGKTTDVWAGTTRSCGSRYPDAAFLADGSAIAVLEGYKSPQEVVHITEGGEAVLASVAHGGSDYLLSVNGRAETVTWSAPDGLRIEGILCVPEGTGPFPLVLNVHGGPVWAYRSLWSMFFSWTPLLVAQGYAVLNPNPRGSSGRGQDFARKVLGDVGGDETGDHLSGIDALVARGQVDPARVAVMGGSHGGYMSAWLVCQDQRFVAAVPYSPVTDWYSQHFTSNIPFFDQLFVGGHPESPNNNFHSRSPISHASKVVTPCLNVAGALDRCTPPGQAEEFHRALLEHGTDSTLVIYPQEGHGVRAFPALIDFCTRVVDFFGVHL
jgi:dipeptidyl aminopeptidase/acylaminoacyl peptidase